MTVVRIGYQRMPELITIDNSLKSLQKEVNGYIEVISPFADNVALICNEEGKIRSDLNQKPSVALIKNNKIIDVIYGTCLLVGTDEDSFCSLTESQCSAYMSPGRYSLCQQGDGSLILGLRIST